MARKVVAGNWKMNLNLAEGLRFMEALNQYLNENPLQHIDAVIAPPFLHLSDSLQAANNRKLSIAAQNCAAYEDGAYTGEVSAKMLADAGVELVILGHSERREFFGESSSVVLTKLRKAIAQELYPIVCVGEKLEQRQAGSHFDYVREQLDESLGDLTARELQRLIVAYEPVWAIGTGETASPEQAQEMHSYLRNHLATRFGSSFAEEVPLLYGGSVKPSNARDIFREPDVDGGLIGGASLDLEAFKELIRIGEEML